MMPPSTFVAGSVSVRGLKVFYRTRLFSRSTARKSPGLMCKFCCMECLVYTGILSPIIGGCISLLAAWLISDVTLFLVYSSGTLRKKCVEAIVRGDWIC